MPLVNMSKMTNNGNDKEKLNGKQLYANNIY